MRVAQRTMYNSFVSNMNRTLSNYMESNIQSSSQKKINRPSDDPVGMARVLNYRAAITRNEQYESNSKDAVAWLRSTDSALTQAQTILSSLQEKAEQLATGTVTSENRKQTSYEIRQLFKQLVNIANTQYGDEHLFAGHKTASTPYEIGLAVTATNFKQESTSLVRFSDGTLGQDDIEVRYSTDGGTTWESTVLKAGQTELKLDKMLDAGGNPVTLTDIPTTGKVSDGITVDDSTGASITFKKDEMTQPLQGVPKTDEGTPVWKVSGSSDTTIMVRFPDGGTLGTAGVKYEYSKDGGETWVTMDPKADYTKLDLDGVEVTIPDNPKVVVEAYDPDEATARDNGSMLFIREAAYYNGDDNDPEPKVDSYGPSTVTKTSAHGNFDKDVRIRLDEAVYPGTDGTVRFSYSTDNGVTWQTGTASTHSDGKVRLNVPGGYLDVTAKELAAGQQFVVRPQRANQGLEIAEGEFLTVTNAGKDIFGGLYTPPDGRGPIAAMGGSAKNIFETVSEFLVWAETGVQSGSQEALANLKAASEGLLTSLAAVGGKEQRAELNLNILEGSRFDMEDRVSAIEDVDLTELIARLARQQMSYQSVLQSSSMIMQLSLMNYL